MRAYVYQAALVCEPCGDKAKQGLSRAGATDDGDSGTFPQGPYGDGGGEADSPQHCDACRVFLENPLTGDGLAYVRERLATASSDSVAVREWLPFYKQELGGVRGILGDWCDDGC